MIIVDPRRGSGELLLPLSHKVQVASEMLPAGDFAFEGNGPEGRVMIGVERKRLSDALQSMANGRFSGYQLIEMTNLYQFLFLLVEGMYRPDPRTGLLEEWRNGQWWPAGHGGRKYMYKDLSHFLTTMQVMTPVRVLRSSTPNETVQMLADLYTWWNDKQWSEHRSHLQMHSKRPPTLRKPPLRRRIANEFPGVGWERSAAIMDHFPTSEAMVLSLVGPQPTYHEWLEIPGVGEGTLSTVIQRFRSE